MNTAGPSASACMGWPAERSETQGSGFLLQAANPYENTHSSTRVTRAQRQRQRQKKNVGRPGQVVDHIGGKSTSIFSSKEFDSMILVKNNSCIK
jgi:hypothetical protein